MTYRIRNIVVAVGLALLAMMLTLFYVTNYKRSVQKDSASVQVYVAAKDLDAGTVGADLVKSHAFRVESIPRKDVVPGAISTPEQVSTLVLAGPMYAGEQVTLRRFSDAAAQGIRSELKGTMRAVQVTADPSQLLAGTLTSGDHVDVVANLRLSNSSSSSSATRIVLRDLTVLTAPSDAGKAGAVGNNATTAVLAVTDTQVQRLFFVMKNADWTLELRPVINATDSRERVDTSDSVLREGR
jgi:Flp pilus assembly protein CpaB